MPVKKKETTKKTTTKPAAKKAAKKPAASTVKKSGGKKKTPAGIRRESAENRENQAEGSIAPPTTHLVDAFAKFRTATRRVAAPSVTRLPAGGALPRPKPPEIPPVAQPPVLSDQLAAPGTNAVPDAAVAAIPVPEAAPAAKPALEPAPADSSAPPETPAMPADDTGEQKPSIPTPKATYKLDPNAVSQFRPRTPMPSAPPKKQKAPRHARLKRKEALQNRDSEFSSTSEDGSTEEASQLKKLKVSTLLTLRELAEKMEITPNELIKKLMTQGVFATINQRLESDTAVLMAHEFGYELEVQPLHMEEEILVNEEVQEDTENLQPRPPVVTVMGHVDHGKTSLLDAIRKTKVTEGESGGITQHIGAYRVATPKGDIAFLDTPGHEAFTAMRSRGAKVTDLVILVVSAVDGIKPQTLEAIDHAKEAGVSIVVAVNKIDLPGANPQKIRTELASRGLNPEEWGGDTPYVDISAKKGENIDKLLEQVLLRAEMLELKANPDRPAIGTVVEAKMEKNTGTVATVLIQRGTVKVGDAFVMGLSGGKVRALISDSGKRIKSAGPSTPVGILGITGNIPQAGDSFTVLENDRMAKQIIEKRNRSHREDALAHKHHVSLLNVRSSVNKELSVIIKADVQGSAEVLKDSLEKLSNDEIRVRVIHAGLGNANESDVLLAEASNAMILLFHVQADARAKEMAEKSSVEMRRYDVIYELTEDVHAALEGLLEPEQFEVAVGKVEIRQEFTIRNSKVAGSWVVEGKVPRGATVKVIRDGEVVGTGRIETLRRFKDDVKEVEKGHECGIVLSGFDAWKEGDLFEVFIKEMRVRRLKASA